MSAALFNDPKAFATALLLEAFNREGMRIFNYEPESVELFVKSIAPKAPAETAYKLNAALGLFTTNLFWQDPIQFGTVCRTLNRATRPMSAEPDINDIAWGITEARLIVGLDNNEHADKFCEAIKAYITYLLKEDKLLTVPDSFDGMDIKISNVTTFDDPEQAVSIQQRADAEAAAIDYLVQKQTAELFKQLKTLNIQYDVEAKKNIDDIVGAYEATNSNNK